MHPSILLALLFVLVALPASAQRVIPLDVPGAPVSAPPPKDYFSKDFGNRVLTNVARPQLVAFLPEAGKGNGTAVVVAPGGGFYALSIDSEGNDVARWLAARGVAAFVLHYRLRPTGDDGAAESIRALMDGTWRTSVSDVAPKAVSDGRAAVAWVRAHAPEFGLRADRVGLLGFSAGAILAAHVAVEHDAASRPDFVAPIYGALAYQSILPPKPVPADAMPMFLVAASDDELGFAKGTVDLYSLWLAARQPVELHLYARGGHGFGMSTQGLPSDTWIDRFGDWMRAQGFLPR